MLFHIQCFSFSLRHIRVPVAVHQLKVVICVISFYSTISVSKWFSELQRLFIHLTVKPVTYPVFCRKIPNLICILTKCTNGLQAAQWKRTLSFHVSGNSIRDILGKKLTLLMSVHSFWKVSFCNCMFSVKFSNYWCKADVLKRTKILTLTFFLFNFIVLKSSDKQAD